MPLSMKNIEMLENMNNNGTKSNGNFGQVESQSQRIIINNPAAGAQGHAESQQNIGGPLSLHQGSNYLAEVQSTRLTLQSRGSTMIQGQNLNN